MRLAVLAFAFVALTTSAEAAQRPEPSLDGGFVYTVKPQSGGSGQIVQTRLATGAQRVVIDGNLVKVIRTGRYAGYLMVQRHSYRPTGGSFDGIWLVRPDAREIFMIPGTDTQDDKVRNAISRSWRRTHAARFDSDR